MTDKLGLSSGLLFCLSIALTVTALVTPNWIVTNVGGPTRMGLMSTCLTLHGRGGREECVAKPLGTGGLGGFGAWQATLLLICLGLLCSLAAAACLLVRPIVSAGAAGLHGQRQRWWRRVKMARLFGLFAVNFFSLASVVFPMGFDVPEIGGVPFQLPNSYHVGLSYILFIMSLWTTLISELLASRVCLPQF